MKDTDKTNRLQKILQSAGFRITKPRLAILSLFSETKMPINAETVHTQLSKSSPKGSIDQVTVYRTLTSFAEKGILKQVDLRKGSMLFELNDHHHHHIICKNCGVIEDFNVCDIEEMTGKILKGSRLFSRLDDHSLELFGLCKKCA